MVALLPERLICCWLFRKGHIKSSLTEGSFAIAILPIIVWEQETLDKIKKNSKLTILLKRNELHHVIKHKVPLKKVILIKAV